MRKLLVKCSCGQEMQVPRSAFGKSGMCSACGNTVRIGSDNTRPFSTASTARGTMGGGPGLNWRRSGGPSEEAKQQFGKAVDLYTTHRYAEALTIFDALARDFPNNPEIEQARRQCLRAMNRTTLPPPPDHPVPTGNALDEGTIKQVLLTKMLHGSTDGIQLQAAELAARMLGILPESAKSSEPPAPTSGRNGHEASNEAPPSSGEPDDLASDESMRD